MIYKKIHIIFLFIIGLLLIFSSCRNDDNLNSDLTLGTNKEIICDARCQYQTIKFDTEEEWTISTDVDWITIKSKVGIGPASVSLYIQQNDDLFERHATICIVTSSGFNQTVRIVQQMPNENGSMTDFTKTYGLGWGYDLKEDVADINGIRGQVFDIEALSCEYDDEDDDVIYIINNTVTSSQYAYGYSHTELESAMSSKVSGTVDLKVASATVSAEYSEQIREQKDRMYIWWRDLRLVKRAYFSNDVDLYDKYIVDWCTTSSFKNSCKNDSPVDIVKKFGTHVVIHSNLGGKFDYYFTVSSDINEKVEKLVTTISAKVLGFKKSATAVDEDTWEDIKRDFKGNFHVEGGGIHGTRLNNALSECMTKGVPISDNSLFENWFNCFSNIANVDDNNLTMIDFQVIPIWDIVSIRNSEKGKAVKEYITKKYLQ